jgi:hypothetical protein
MRSYVSDLEDRLDNGDDYDDEDDEDDEGYDDDDEDGDEGTRRMTLDEITSENLPSADDLEAELQEYLRKQRDDG